MKPTKLWCLLAVCSMLLFLTATQIGCPPPSPEPGPGVDQGETAGESPPEEGVEPAEGTEEPAAEEPAAEEPAEEPAAEAETETEPAMEGTEVAAAEPAPAVEEPAPAAEAEAPADAWAPPAGLPQLPVPDDNPMSAEKVELGKLLYFDTRLSGDGTISCATCHDPQKGWAEHQPTSEGIGGQKGGRNAPTVINAAYADAQFWDGRAASLEEQALGPIQNPIEMGHKMTAVVEDLNKLDVYKDRFQAVFGTDVTEEGIAKAIAAFERTVLSGNSAYDKFTAGDESALTDAQKRGWALFDENCAVCHTPPRFSNYGYYNAGVGMDKEKPDEGRKDVTGEDRDLGKFRVPALRDVADTAPYFHDGSAATLKDAVTLMAGGGKDNDNLSRNFSLLRGAELSEDDINDLVEFLGALSGDYPKIEPPELP